MSTKVKQAFPLFGVTGIVQPGMSMHEYYMAHAPITIADAEQYVVAVTLNHRDGVSYKDVMLAMKSLREQYANAMLGIEEAP